MLTPKMKRRLKSAISSEKPTVNIGKEGITPQMIKEVTKQLGAREIIKIKILKTALQEEDTKNIAASIATLDIIKEEKLLENAKKLGGYFTSRLKELQNNYELIGDIRGPGLMLGIELVKNKKTKEMANDICHQIVGDALKDGVIFGESRFKGMGNVLKIKPPLTITESQDAQSIGTLLIPHRHNSPLLDPMLSQASSCREPKLLAAFIGSVIQCLDYWGEEALRNS